MIRRLYSVYDRVAKIFSVPMWDHNDGTAMRSFRGSLKGKDPEDYDLYYVGSFDDETSRLDDCLIDHYGDQKHPVLIRETKNVEDEV